MTALNEIGHRSQYEQYDQTALIKKAIPNTMLIISPIVLALVIIAGLTLNGVMGGVAASGAMVGLSVPLIIGAVIEAIRNEDGFGKLVNSFQALILTVGLILAALAIPGILPVTNVAISVFLGVIFGGVMLSIFQICLTKPENKIQAMIVENREH